MVKKEFTFRGKTLPELQAMDMTTYVKLLRARERRTAVRFQDKALNKRIQKALAEKGLGKEPKAIRTHLREVVILPNMVGLKFAIHRGNSFETFEVKPEMLGHRFGEFVLTRKRLQHGKAGIGATKSSTAITARG